MLDANHEAEDHPLVERASYAAVVASMAAADGDFDDRERARIEELCAALDLPEAETARVLALAMGEGDLGDALDVLQRSDLRFTLYTDCLLLAHADDELVEQEEARLARIAEVLAISDAQRDALRRFAEALSREPPKQPEVEDLRAMLKEAQIPLRMVRYVSATGAGVVGSTVALGMLAAVAGIPAGIGALLGLGASAIIGVRWLEKQLDAKR
ncbi:MAG: TerB family tellurite resistance protein [Polyangiaceae bacterium]